ncbi:hypothetical protein RRG08_065239 [Elysia crispata]|uniref:Uncharacterized protein n=1 Tax=Elysia crispata TaxID=231223 RepID=A0AAE0YIH0_9GAST|nr:hypothetical protein RRG08_065239 [Elysia crispata]
MAASSRHLKQPCASVVQASSVEHLYSPHEVAVTTVTSRIPRDGLGGPKLQREKSFLDCVVLTDAKGWSEGEGIDYCTMLHDQEGVNDVHDRKPRRSEVINRLVYLQAVPTKEPANCVPLVLSQRVVASFPPDERQLSGGNSRNSNHWSQWNCEPSGGRQVLQRAGCGNYPESLAVLIIIPGHRRSPLISPALEIGDCDYVTQESPRRRPPKRFSVQLKTEKHGNPRVFFGSSSV